MSDKEKTRVKILVYEYMAKEPVDFERYNDELAKLLDKAFPAAFNGNILHRFTAARKVNSDLLGIQTFAEFASWWEARDVKSRDDSSGRSTRPVKKVPRDYFMQMVRNLAASFLKVPVI